MPLLESGNVSGVIPETTLEWALKEFFYAHKKQSESLTAGRKSALANCLAGSFGYCLNTYYLGNPGLPFPGSVDSLFPEDYLSLHDSHHVLVGATTQESGEVYVTAFECGLMSQEARILPVLAQIQVLLEHKGIDLFDAAIAFNAFEIGRKTNRSLLDRFDPWESLSIPIDALRDSLGIVPLSRVWG